MVLLALLVDFLPFADCFLAETLSFVTVFSLYPAKLLVIYYNYDLWLAAFEWIVEKPLPVLRDSGIFLSFTLVRFSSLMISKAACA